MSVIKTGHARKLVQNLKTNEIGKNFKENDTRAVWFHRDVILKALEGENGIPASGLRFYFAAYENSTDSKIPPLYEKDKGRLTLVIVPTKELDKNGKSRDHEYRKEKCHFDNLQDVKANPGYDSDHGKGGLKELNDGQIYPPPPIKDGRIPDDESLYFLIP